MTSAVLSRRDLPAPQSRPRHYLMVRPSFFDVEYAINPWMNTAVPVDTERAVAQWQNLVDTYRGLGHTVEELDPVPGLPDMVFAANGALVTPTATVGARFCFPQRRAEAAAHAAWLEAHGLGPVHQIAEVNEGEGDFLVVGERILAGTGFRTATAAHARVAEITGMPVITLQLVDPRYYHLDTVIAVLGDDQIAYYPPAFSVTAQATLATLYPDALIADEADAGCFALNAVSDGRNVVIPAEATAFAEKLAAAGYRPVPVPLDELLKGGGSVKCCTQELRRPLR